MKVEFSRLLIIFAVLFCLGLSTVPVAAQENVGEKIISNDKASAESETSGNDAATLDKSFPGVSEIVPRATTVAEEADQAMNNLAAFQDVSDLEKQLQELKEQQEPINKLGNEMQAAKDPSYDQMIYLRSQVGKQEKNLEAYAEVVSGLLSQVEAINLQWMGKKEFWQNWKKTLLAKYQAEERNIPEESLRKEFLDAEEVISDILNQSQKAFLSLVGLQQEVSSLQERNHAHTLWIEGKLGAIRKNLFKKNGLSFNNPEFYKQFGPSLWAEFLAGYRSLADFDKKYFLDQGWIFALQIVLAIVIIVVITQKRGRLKDVEEWTFFYEHPVAVGFFIAFVTLNFLYAGIPSLLRLIVWVVAATSISFIVASFLKDKRKIFLIFLLAFLSILTVFLETISFPQPLFRLYRVVICLLGIPFLWRMSKIKIEHLAGTGRFISCLLNASWSFRVGAGVLLVVFAAELGGYAAFSSWLLESAVFTVFILIFTAMAIRLGEGAVVFAASKIHFEPRSFLDNIRENVTGRIKLLLRIVPIIIAGLYVLKLWVGSVSISVLWKNIMGFQVTIGNFKLSVSMLFLALLFIYLSIAVSWALGLFFEKELFPRKRMSRGVQDLVKKMVHYSLILVGSLLALSALGLDLQNFAVLAGAFGIGIGFGLQNIVNNFVSGLILLFERPITVGDVIVFQGEWGTVNRIGLRSTVVETYDRSEVIVPNSQLVSEAVINWTLSSTASRIILPVGVAYGTDIDSVLNILEDIGRKHRNVLNEPAPYAIFIGFGDSSLDFELRVYVADINVRLSVKSDLGKAIDLRFKKEGVEIPFPQRDLHLRSVDEHAGRVLLGSPVSRRRSEGPLADGNPDRGPKSDVVMSEGLNPD